MYITGQRININVIVFPFLWNNDSPRKQVNVTTECMYVFAASTCHSWSQAKHFDWLLSDIFFLMDHRVF